MTTTEQHAVVLLAATIAALVRAIRAGRAIVFTAAGLAAVVAAGLAGASIAGGQSNGASLGMAWPPRSPRSATSRRSSASAEDRREP